MQIRDLSKITGGASETAEAIVADGTDKGKIRKVCANPDCRCITPRSSSGRVDADAAMRAEQEKQPPRCPSLMPGDGEHFANVIRE